MDNWLDGQRMNKGVAGWLHDWSAQRALDAGGEGGSGVESSS